MGELLWSPSAERVSQANVTRFIEFVNRTHGLTLESYRQLSDWSVERIPDFWASMWHFAEMKASRPYDMVVDDLSRFPGAKWFPGAELNFAENLLRHRDNRAALVFKGETQQSRSMTYAELHDHVARLVDALRRNGVKPGDRVCAYMPNLIETAVALLASTSLGGGVGLLWRRARRHSGS